MFPFHLYCTYLQYIDRYYNKSVFCVCVHVMDTHLLCILGHPGAQLWPRLPAWSLDELSTHKPLHLTHTNIQVKTEYLLTLFLIFTYLIFTYLQYKPGQLTLPVKRIRKGNYCAKLNTAFITRNRQKRPTRQLLGVYLFSKTDFIIFRYHIRQRKQQLKQVKAVTKSETGWCRLK